MDASCRAASPPGEGEWGAGVFCRNSLARLSCWTWSSDPLPLLLFTSPHHVHQACEYGLSYHLGHDGETAHEDAATDEVRRIAPMHPPLRSGGHDGERARFGRCLSEDAPRAAHYCAKLPGPGSRITAQTHGPHSRSCAVSSAVDDEHKTMWQQMIIHVIT